MFSLKLVHIPPWSLLTKAIEVAKEELFDLIEKFAHRESDKLKAFIKKRNLPELLHVPLKTGEVVSVSIVHYAENIEVISDHPEYFIGIVTDKDAHTGVSMELIAGVLEFGSSKTGEAARPIFVPFRHTLRRDATLERQKISRMMVKTIRKEMGA